MRKLRVCGVQIATKPMAIKENLEKMALWAKKAVKEFAPHLIVFPETITTTFNPNLSLKELLKEIEPIPGYSTKFIANLCKELKVDIVLPIYEKKGNIIYNDAVYIDKTGKTLGVYRKTHPFTVEDIRNKGGWTTAGEDIIVVKTKLANIGLIICYDGDFPELSRILRLKGAEIIVRPSAFLRSFDIWDLTNRARAHDNQVYVVGVNATGLDGKGNPYFGHSMIVDPMAHKIALARSVEEIIFAELELPHHDTMSYGITTKRCFDHIKDRNVNAYKKYFLKKTKS